MSRFAVARRFAALSLLAPVTAVADPAMPPWSAFALVGVGANDVDLAPNSNVTGQIHANSLVDVKANAHAGIIEAGAEIDVAPNAVVGNLTAKKFDIKKNAVTGTIKIATVPNFTLPVVNANPDLTKDIKREGKTPMVLTLVPGRYGDVISAKGDTIVLTSGEYHFNSLWVKHSGKIQVHLSGNVPLVVRVAGNLRFGIDDEMIEMSTDGGDASDILFLVGGSSCWLRASSSVQGTYIAPQGDVIVGVGTTLNGAALGSQVEAREGARINFINYDHANGLALCSSAAQCDDGQACTSDICDASAGCKHSNNSLGCSDGNACTAGDSCSGGSCHGGLPINCDDHNGCTTDSCNPASGCVNVVNSAVCTDGNACTVGDHCAGGTCVTSGVLNCDDHNVCSDDSCSAASGCVNSNGFGACSDGNACTLNDACSGGVCVPGSAADCNDGNPCTDNSCSIATGCNHSNNTTACEDGNACTLLDKCGGGVCSGGVPTPCVDGNACTVDACIPGIGCVFTSATAGVACNDGNACTQSDTCQSGTCVAANPVTCSASDQCHVAGTCNPGSGACSNPSKADGSGCSDGNACTQSDTCQAGTCNGANPVTCSASDQCHSAGTCDSATGTCSNPSKADGSACSDGNACTQSDTCQAGTCNGANPVTCSASDQCHSAGTCDAATGTCSNPAKADGSGCSDGNACTQSDTCQAGTCNGANPVTCSASDQCHSTGTCDSATGICSNPSKADGSVCNDGNACTQSDTCQAGTCNGANPVTCSASDQCHDAGICDASTGTCSNPSKADGSACSDGNACTQSDTCQAGTCSGSNSVTCSASDQCHDAGICDASTGTCSNPSKADGSACNDGNSCTQSDTCQVGTCNGSIPVTCSASDQCHSAGTCNPASGICSNPNKGDGSVCNDGNACTQSDTCQAGTCNGSNPVTCSASDQCHVAGTCNAATGTCSNPAKADGSACSDGNACTQSDTCQAGTCNGSNPVTCSASDQCHVAGTCNTASGICSNPSKADGSVCSDGNACTQSDTCQAGTCNGSNPVTCSASDQCHVAGTCNPGSGTCSNPSKADGSVCSDGNACTQSDTCQNGSCNGGNSVVCAPLSGAELVVNGSFEQGSFSPVIAGNWVDICTGCAAGNAAITGWTVSGKLNWSNNVQIHPTADGSKYVDLEDGSGKCSGSALRGVVSQTIPTTAGQTYHLKFSLAAPYDSNDTCSGTLVRKIRATAGSVSNDFTTPASPYGALVWEVKTLDFVATASTTVLSFSSPDGNLNGFWGPALDLVSVHGSSECTTNGCDAATGTCVVSAKPEGTTCSDGNACTQVDTCASGTCVGSSLKTCVGGGDQCHDNAGSCDLVTGNCVFPAKPTGTACNDGSLCTPQDICIAGTCTGINAPYCAPQNGCQDPGTCNPATGVCSHPFKSDGSVCDDGNLCTQNDSCLSGACAAGAPVVCGATGDPCLEATCDPGVGTCSTNLKSGSCDDGNACTTNDTCVTSCSATSLKITWLATSCDSGKFTLSINSGASTAIEVPSDCDFEVQERVTVISDASILSQITGCNDLFELGSTGYSLYAGYFKVEVSYASGQPESVCVYDAAQNNCESRPLYWGYEADPYPSWTYGPCSGTCNTAKCSGEVLYCPAGDACHTPGTCDPGNGNCISGAPVNCNDGIACTLDACDNAFGCSHVAQAAACNDGVACTLDACNVASGCSHTPQAAICDDGNLCTNDSCSGSGCQHVNNSVACDDGSACTSDFCNGGACKSTSLCTPQGKVCTADACIYSCVTSTPDAITGQKCPIATPCTQNSDCGTQTSANNQMWMCISNKCQFVPQANGFTVASGTCNANLVIRQVTSAPFDKKVLIPSLTTGREATSLTIEIQNTTASALYLDQIPLTLESMGMSSFEYDILRVNMYASSNGVSDYGDGNNGLNLVCIAFGPFAGTVNETLGGGQTGGCGVSAFSQIPAGATRRFVLDFAFQYIGFRDLTNRQYRLNLASTAGFKARVGSTAAAPTAQTACMVPGTPMLGSFFKFAAP